MRTQLSKLALTATIQPQQGDPTMKTPKLIAIFLAIFAIATYAENADQLKKTIADYVGCTGNLTTTVKVGNLTTTIKVDTVTITDTLNCKSSKILTLNIDSNVRVVWKANFTGNVINELIVKKGKGDLVIDGGFIKNNTSNSVYNAIRIDEGNLFIHKGEISAGAGYGVRNNSTGTVTITGGNISMSGGSRGSSSSVGVYNASTGTVNISGNTTISAGHAVQNTSTGTVNISGGTLSGASAVYNVSTGTVNISGGIMTSVEDKTIFGLSSGGTINISGGEISANKGVAVSSAGKVIISPPAKITSITSK